MNIHTSHALIRKIFQDYWNQHRVQIPVVWDNDDTVPPEGTSWVRVAIIPGTTSQISFGGSPDERRWRSLGIVDVQIFVPLNTGTGVLEELADDVRQCLQGQTYQSGEGDVRFRATSLVRAGTSGSWMQFNASTPFESDFIA